MNSRQSGILTLLKNEKRMSVQKLAKHFFVSEMTVRRDLREMEQSGYIKRYHGGAILDDSSLLPITVRKFEHFDRRDAIMNNARKHLKNNLTVFLDSSSTCTYIIPAIAEFEGITIVTNSVQNVLSAEKHHIKCVLAGGDYYEHDMCTIGSCAESFLRGINADVSFFSAQGISSDGIISDSDENQSAIRKIMLENSEKSIFFFNKSKTNTKYTYTICRGEIVDEIIIFND